MILRYLVLGSMVVFAQEARDYERTMGRWTRQLAPQLIQFAGPADGTKVLDYGCATGGVALRVAAKFRNANVVGVDVPPAFIEFARTQTASAKVRFDTADLIRLPYANGEFDATLSVSAISAAADPGRAVAEMKRVTKPEGIVAAAVWDYGGMMQPLQLFWNAAIALEPTLTPADGANTPFSKKGQLQELWQSAGFRDVVEQPLELDLTFNSFDDYWSVFLTGQGAAGAWLTAQPQEKRNAIRERLRARVLGSRADGPFTLRARAYAVKGVVRYD